MSLGLAERGGVVDLGPVSLQVRRIIEERIVTNALRPGERLSENELSGQLGVSRQPVREALIRLAEAGLVRVLPQRATVVTRISVARVSSARFLREAVERAVVRRAHDARHDPADARAHPCAGQGHQGRGPRGLSEP